MLMPLTPKYFLLVSCADNTILGNELKGGHCSFNHLRDFLWHANMSHVSASTDLNLALRTLG